MDISSQEIEAIVKQVLAGMGGAQTSAAQQAVCLAHLHPAVQQATAACSRT